MTKEKPWNGRFNEPTDAFVEAFTASVSFDQRLYRHDIQGSIAHAPLLAHVGVLSAVARIGDAGKKLHTGRSRNDQVATDLRLYLRDAIDELRAGLRRLQSALVD